MSDEKPLTPSEPNGSTTPSAGPWQTVLEIAAQELASEDLRELSGAIDELSAKGQIPLPEPSLAIEDDIQTKDPPEAREKRATDIRGLIASMTMAQKLKTAMSGNAIVRRLLIQDPSRLVQECVLNNPKLGMNEIEDFARNTNVDAQVLRSISGRSTWVRNYRVKANLVMNPKCPPDLSLRWLRFLHDNDVKLISKSRNVPQVVQVAAKKKLSEKE